jgi:hypothetical protein
MLQFDEDILSFLHVFYTGVDSLFECGIQRRWALKAPIIPLLVAEVIASIDLRGECLKGSASYVRA